MQQGGERNIGRPVFLYTVIVAAVMICGAGALLFYKQSRGAAADLAVIEHQLINQQKSRLQHDVEALIVWIDRQRAGTGELRRSYVDVAVAELGVDAPGAGYVTEQAQQVLLEALAEDPGAHGQNYFFIYQLHDLAGGKDFATMLFNPQRPDLAGQKLSDDETDAAGNYYRKAFMKDIRSSGESALIYSYSRQDPSAATQIGRRMSYFKLYPEWNWVIAKGVNLDEIDQLIAEMAEAGEKGLLRDLLLLAILFAGGILLAVGFSKAAGARIDHTLAAYRQSEERNSQTIASLTKRLEQQSRADTLTAAYNRSYFEQELAKETSRSTRYQTPLSTVMFAVDNFRAINDELGTQAGDRVLQELVDLVTDNIRRTDILARFGAAEFVILAPGIDLEQALLFAEKLRLLIEEKIFSTGRPLTCCFGVSYYSGSEDPSVFVRRTEAALAAAKKQGTNSCIAQQG